jgi:hypothetical protein
MLVCAAITNTAVAAFHKHPRNLVEQFCGLWNMCKNASYLKLLWKGIPYQIFITLFIADLITNQSLNRH